MCIYCEQSISDNEIFSGLYNSINDDFERYDDITLRFLIIFGSGHRGGENRDISIKIFENYNKWLFDNPNQLLSDLFTNENIDKILLYLNNHELTDNNENKLIDYIDNIYLSLE